MNVHLWRTWRVCMQAIPCTRVLRNMMVSALRVAAGSREGQCRWVQSVAWAGVLCCAMNSTPCCEWDTPKWHGTGRCLGARRSSHSVAAFTCASRRHNLQATQVGMTACICSLDWPGMGVQLRAGCAGQAACHACVCSNDDTVTAGHSARIGHNSMSISCCWLCPWHPPGNDTPPTTLDLERAGYPVARATSNGWQAAR
jgi:hypothetical protein